MDLVNRYDPTELPPELTGYAAIAQGTITALCRGRQQQCPVQPMTL
jgi:hypothetical protein